MAQNIAEISGILENALARAGFKIVDREEDARIIYSSKDMCEFKIAIEELP